MINEDIQSSRSVYGSRAGEFEQLRTICYGLIQNTLKQGGIEYLSLQSRVKELDSAFEKAKSKKYDDPFNEITDFVALRVIVFLDRDVDAAATLLRRLFEIDSDNSIDKRQPEKVDSVGYRSLHLVCGLGASREHLEEYKAFSGVRFEIQIRTALQHAWAEIEHKRRYKGNAALPNDLQHRLMALSGTLELVDREFSAIATEADAYIAEVQDQESTEADQDGLSGLAMAAVYAGMPEVKAEQDVFILVSGSEKDGFLSEVQQELERFDVRSVGDLKQLVSSVNLKKIADAARARSIKIGPRQLIRVAMMQADLDRYFAEAFGDSFKHITLDEVYFLEDVLGKSNLQHLFGENNVDIIPF